MSKKIGFCLYHEVTKTALTDRSGKVLFFVSYQNFIEYMKKNRINTFDYRARLVCKRFTRNYSVI